LNATTRTANGKRRALIVIAALGACIYMGIAVTVDAGRLGDTLRQLGWLGCASVLGLSGLNYLVRFHRWQTYVRTLGGHVPVGRHFLYYLSGFAFTVSPGKAGEAVRSVYLRDHGVPYAGSLAAFFAERLLDLISVVLLSCLIVIDHPAYRPYRPLLIGVIGIVALVLFVVGRPSLATYITSLGARRTGRAAKLIHGLANLLRSSDRLLKPQLLVFGMLLGVIAWGAEGLGFYLVCQGLHIPIEVGPAVGIYSVAVLAGSAAIFLPGGIGGMEIVMSTLLVEAGATLKTAVIATMLCRLATLWFAVLIGVMAASIIELKARDKVIS